MKRGQVTVFVIIGIVLVVIAGAYFIINTPTISQEASPLNTDSPIKRHIESCITSTAKEGLIDIGYQGFYFILPEKSTTDLFENVAYISPNEPSDENIASELALYIDTMIDLCYDFSLFEGMEITAEDSKTKVELGEIINIDSKIPIKIKEGETKSEMNSFSVSIDGSKFLQDLSLARKVAGSIEDNKVCLTCFSSEAREADYLVNINPYEESYFVDMQGENRIRFVIDNEE